MSRSTPDPPHDSGRPLLGLQRTALSRRRERKRPGWLLLSLLLHGVVVALSIAVVVGERGPAQRGERGRTIATKRLETVGEQIRDINAAKLRARVLALIAIKQQMDAILPDIDGATDDWKQTDANIGSDIHLRIAYDEDYLYLCYDVRGHGPMKNTGDDWRTLFKNGAACDLLIAADPAAPTDRRQPAPGDKRILLTQVGKTVHAVLYEPVAPDAPAEQQWTATSPIHTLDFDRVVQLPRVRIAVQEQPDGYVLEAAIPLRDIDLKIPANGRLKLDWGILRTGPDGYAVQERIYWANRAARIIADTPSEARLTPDMWGHILFHSRPAGPGSIPDAAAGELTHPDDLDDLLQDLTGD